MKITIAFLPGETLSANTVEEFCRAVFPNVTVRKSDRHAPYKHVYLTTKKPGKPCDSSKSS